LKIALSRPLQLAAARLAQKCPVTVIYKLLFCISAGVGRTGTYIAVDALMNQLRERYTVDVYGVVYKMRMNRPYMVQTPVINHHYYCIILPSIVWHHWRPQQP